jgi:oligopeptide/dipeptide ABC transporter ATP-binding protein
MLPLRAGGRRGIGQILRVEELVKEFPVRGGLLNRVKGKIKAVDGVSFEVEEGTTFGIAGESGSGKTTLCMTIAKLLEPTSGRIILDGKDYGAARGEELREFRTRLQIVFQNPISSLDPHMTVGTIVTEPLRALERRPRTDGEEVVRKLLEKVGLPPSVASRYPHELSGGQAQRVSIARALSVSPKVLLLDEPTSALDVSVQAQVLNIFNELQKDLGVTYVIVSHDLSVIGHMCDEVAIMYAGKFVEVGTYKEVFYEAAHPYTAALLASAHMMGDPSAEARFGLRNLIASPRNLPAGCTLNPRCPFASQVCRETYPKMVDIGSGHLVACHNKEQLTAAWKVGA